MMPALRPLVALLLVLAGCERCTPPWEPSAEESAAGEEASGANTAPGEAPSEAATEPPPGLAALRLVAEPDAYGEIALRVEAREPVEISGSLSLERRSGGGFEAVEGAAVSLRADCQSEAPRCLTLVAGAELRPPAVTSARGQCAAKEPALAAGEYRIVATSCEGGHRVESAGFTL